MAKYKLLPLQVLIGVILLSLMGNWVYQVRAENAHRPALGATGTPVPQPLTLQRDLSSPVETEIMGVIQSYFEDRYRAFSTLQLNDLGTLVSIRPDAKSFRNAELDKLAVELKHAELNQLRYMDYEFFLDFREIILDNSSQAASVSIIENNQVVYEISSLLNPKDPVVTRMSGLEHKIELRKEAGQWKIFSHNYDDYLWRLLKQTRKSPAEMLQSMKSFPEPASRNTLLQSSFSCNLYPDESTHTYQRDGAVAYAVAHAAKPNYNPDYPDYDDGVYGDCTNFVSQALYEGGNVSMAIPDPLPPPSPQGQLRWYLLDDTRRASAWNDVGALHDFITHPYAWNEGPEGCEASIDEIDVGDIIQYEWNDLKEGPDNYVIWDHSVIVIKFIDSTPYVASHSPNVEEAPYNYFDYFGNYEDIRFIHIERSDGYSPIKSKVEQNSDDGGTNPSGCLFSSSDNEVYLGSCSGGGNITSGFRFNHIHIPRRAEIKYAFVIFTVDGTYTNALEVQIYGEDSGNADTFSASNPPSGRLPTSASVPWSISGTWSLGLRRTTPQLSAVIEEIVTHQDWNPGNSLALIIKNIVPGTLHRRVIALERASWDPELTQAKLIIAYSGGEPPAPSDTPTSTPTFTPTFTPTSTPTPTPTSTFTPTPTSTPDTPDPPPAPGWASAEMVLMQDESMQQRETYSSILSEVRDQVMIPSPKGEIYIEKTYQHAPEIMRLFLQNPSLRVQVKKLAIEVQPLLESLINEDYTGEGFQLEKKWIRRTLRLLNKIEKKSSPELRQEIQWWKDQLPGFEGKTGPEIWELLPER